jgi:hypothetical protein
MFLDIAVRHFTTTAKTLRGVPLRAWAMTEAAPLRRRHCIRRIRRRDQSARDEFVIEASNSYPEGNRDALIVSRVRSPACFLTARVKHVTEPECIRYEAAARSFNSGQHSKGTAANVERTFWSPKWSPTGDHGPVLNGMQRHVRPIFAIQINTCQERTKRVGTSINKFRVRCLQALSHLSRPYK